MTISRCLFKHQFPWYLLCESSRLAVFLRSSRCRDNTLFVFVNIFLYFVTQTNSISLRFLSLLVQHPICSYKYTIPCKQVIVYLFRSRYLIAYAISAPLGIGFSGVIRERFPSASSAQRSMPSERTPASFAGFKFTSTITFLPTISSGE